MSVFCPLALFKLLAFVDPGTASGQRLRTSMADAGIGGASSTSTAGGLAASSGSTPQEATSSDQVETRWGNALGRLSAAHATLGSAAQRVMSTAAPVLAAAGVGDGVDHDSSGARCRPGDEPRAAGNRGGSDVNTAHRRAAQST